MRKAFVQALRGMEPLDAKLLKLLHNHGWLEFANVPGGGFNTEKIASLEERETAVAVSLGNLFGLGCVVTDVRASQTGLDLIPGGAGLNPRIFYRLSTLGTALLRLRAISVARGETRDSFASRVHRSARGGSTPPPRRIANPRFTRLLAYWAHPPLPLPCPA